jgi:hypothetical protein
MDLSPVLSPPLPTPRSVTRPAPAKRAKQVQYPIRHCVAYSILEPHGHVPNRLNLAKEDKGPWPQRNGTNCRSPQYVAHLFCTSTLCRRPQRLLFGCRRPYIDAQAKPSQLPVGACSTQTCRRPFWGLLLRVQSNTKGVGTNQPAIPISCCTRVVLHKIESLVPSRGCRRLTKRNQLREYRNAPARKSHRSCESNFDGAQNGNDSCWGEAAQSMQTLQRRGAQGGGCWRQCRVLSEKESERATAYSLAAVRP